MEKQTIKNRNGLKIVTQLEKAKNPVGLAIVVHGLGGFKEQDQIEVFAQAFKDANYTVLRYDSTHAFGESEGDYSEATTTGYYQDLEDVIDWAKDQDWYMEPFTLAGHSQGGFSIILYVQKYSQKVKALAPIATMISRELLEQAYKNPEFHKKWQEQGYIETPSPSKPGVIKRLNWSYMEDAAQYDIFPDIDKLTMPVLLMAGEKDKGTPPKHQQILYDKLTGQKEIHTIKGVGHNFRSPEALDEIKQIFDNWIKKI